MLLVISGGTTGEMGTAALCVDKGRFARNMFVNSINHGNPNLF